MSMTSHGERVGANVRAEMARSKRTQSALANSIGMKQQALSRRLSGTTPFTVDELGRVADVLGTSIAHLVDDRVPA